MSAQGAARAVRRGDLLWRPTESSRERSELARYAGWLQSERGLRFAGYEELWKWSVTDLEGFWRSIWDFFGLRADGGAPERMLAHPQMPGAQWCPGARLNYAENLWHRGAGDEPAVLGRSQTRADVDLTWRELRELTRRIRAGLVALGVGRGDRVAGYLPNVPEAVAAFLATASLGAIWATCPPEFGVRAVAERFGPLKPKVLLAVGGYVYGDRTVDRRDDVARLEPLAEHLVELPFGPPLPAAGRVGWDRFTAIDEPIAFEQLPFEHPLYVLFSSGTTGPPKPIVHGHGGILLEHAKNQGLSWNLAPGRRLQWYTTTGWMMWNALVSGLLVGASIVTIDGHPAHPDLMAQWRLAAATGATTIGFAPAFLMACRNAGLTPGRDVDLSSVIQVGAAGSPLPPEGYDWVCEQIGEHALLNVGSGGTDVCTGLVGNNDLMPVWAGEMSGRALGVAADAFDRGGRPVTGAVGELVVTEPMPSMPVGFWGDDSGERLRASYFDTFPGVWRHGDWIEFTARGSCVISGRSDATLNRGGVRLGTGELYDVVESVDGILDSLAVHLEDPEGGSGRLLLFVELRDGLAVDGDLRRRLAGVIRTALSPRHVPDDVIAIPAVPRTLTGKKLEVPVKRLLLGAPLESVASADTLADPSSLDPFAEFAARAHR